MIAEPTEPVFHNCADVAITRGSSTPKSFGSLFGLVRYERVPCASTDTVSLISGDGTVQRRCASKEGIKY